MGTVEERIAAVEARAGEHSVMMDGIRQSVDRLDALLVVIFITVVLLVVASSAWEWVQVLRKRKPAVVRESPFVETAYAN